MPFAARRPLSRRLLPWALLCVPLVFAARAATDYNAASIGRGELRDDVATGRQPTAAHASAGAPPSYPPAPVSAGTLLRLTTTLGSQSGQDSAERRLLHAYAEIAAGHLAAAREQAEALVREHPHFSLAQLLLGDVMRASRGETAAFAAAPTTLLPQQLTPYRERVLELRAEALARLGAYTAPPPADAIPANLVTLAPDVPRAIVVDTGRSRLYLFQQRNGIPHLEASYYFSQGKLGDGKTRAGDMKTPLGIYFITRKIDGRDLKPLYGAGALTLNYPNEWDKQQGHTGFGVWLHGTPPDSYARVPLASDGCLVLSNPDLRKLMADTPAGSTPVIVTRQVQWLSPAQWAAQRQHMLAQLQADITRSAQLGLRPQDALASAPAGQTPQRGLAVRPDALTILQYPGQIVVQYSADDSAHATLYRQYWAQRSAQWQLIFQGSVS
jgi:lipoprotein-anchoring transpeptidase ErfK/SrfK